MNNEHNNVKITIFILILLCIITPIPLVLYLLFGKNNSRKKRIICTLVALFVSIPLITYTLYWGYSQFGWFDSFSDMNKIEVPIEEPAKGGTCFLPKGWKLCESNGWYYINDENDELIAFEIYHGYREKINDKYNWQEYTLNPMINDYENYDDVKYYSLTNESNNCALLKSDKYYKINFFCTCGFNKSELKNRNYSREYLFINYRDEKVLKRIHASYEWAGIL